MPNDRSRSTETNADFAPPKMHNSASADVIKPSRSSIFPSITEPGSKSLKLSEQDEQKSSPRKLSSSKNDSDSNTSTGSNSNSAAILNQVVSEITHLNFTANLFWAKAAMKSWVAHPKVIRFL